MNSDEVFQAGLLRFLRLRYDVRPSAKNSQVQASPICRRDRPESIPAKGIRQSQSGWHYALFGTIPFIAQSIPSP